MAPAKWEKGQYCTRFRNLMDFQDLNNRHAVVMLGGKYTILNQTWDPVHQRWTVTFSTENDFKARYRNQKSSDRGHNSIAEEWLDSPNRRTFQGVVFCPGKIFRDITICTGASHANRYRETGASSRITFGKILPGKMKQIIGTFWAGWPELLKIPAVNDRAPLLS